MFRICYQTPAGWFFWTDENYSNREKPLSLIAAMHKGYKENCFLVYPDGKGNWIRE